MLLTRPTVTTLIALTALAGLTAWASPTTDQHEIAAPVRTADPSSASLPQHYSGLGAHLRGDKRVTPTNSYATGNPRAKTVVYVIGDSMAGQAAYATHLARPEWTVKPRTKSATAFQLPTDTSERGRYSAKVLAQMKKDKRNGKHVIAVIGSQKGSEMDRRRTIYHLRKAGISPRLITASPQAKSFPTPGKTFQLKNSGPGRAATLKAAAATHTPVLDVYPIAVRRTENGDPERVVRGHEVLRNADHLNVGFADRILPWHIKKHVLHY